MVSPPLADILADTLDPSERTRAPEWAALAGCLLGGITEYLCQNRDPFGGDEVLIYGAGVWLSREVLVTGYGAHPMVLADPSLVDNANLGAAVRAHDFQNLIQYLRLLTGGAEPPIDLVAVSSDMPSEHFAEGGTANPGTANQGVLGAGATMNGRPCILTAGHVAARQATTPIGRGSGMQLGTSGGLTSPVVYATHAGTTNSRTQVADIAVAELGLAPGRHSSNFTPGLPSVDDNLIRLGGSKVGAGGLPYRGFCDWVRVDPPPNLLRPGLWGKMYMTESPIGQPGDSGSPVINALNRIVGHYLGATTANGFVQNLDYQLPYGCTVP
jgi:hypothetical protein